LERIELRNTRLENRFMGRDYVTIREEKRDGQSFWAETPVGRWRINSAPGRALRQGSKYRIAGAASGAAIARVEVQIDGGSWRRDRRQAHILGEQRTDRATRPDCLTGRQQRLKPGSPAISAGAWRCRRDW